MLLRDLGEWELLRRLAAFAPPGQLDDDAAILAADGTARSRFSRPEGIGP